MLKKLFIIFLTILTVFSVSVSVQAEDYSAIIKNETSIMSTLFISIENVFRTVFNKDLKVTGIRMEAENTILPNTDMRTYAKIRVQPEKAKNDNYTPFWYKKTSDDNYELISSSLITPSEAGTYLFVARSNEGGYKTHRTIEIINNSLYCKTVNNELFLRKTNKAGYTKCVDIQGYSEDETITKITIEEPIILSDASYFFANFINVTTINNLNYINTSYASDFEGMFWNCWSLKELDISSFCMHRATSACAMFGYCMSLTNLKLGEWNAPNLGSTSYMFYFCEKLGIIDTTKFITSETKLTDLSYMFYNCPLITELKLSNWDTSRVTDMQYLFYNCRSLMDINLTGWDTSNVTNMRAMFSGVGNCASRDSKGNTVVNLIKDNSGKVINPKITGLENFNTSNVTDMSSMFSGGVSHPNTLSVRPAAFETETLNRISNWDVSNVVNMTCMFYGQTKMTDLDISKWHPQNCVSFNHMFCDCTSLKTLNLQGWTPYVTKVVTMYDMFDDCVSLTTVGDISQWETNALMDIGGLFNHCEKLTGNNGVFDLSGWNTSNILSIGEAFYGMNSCQVIDLSGWDTSKVRNENWNSFDGTIKKTTSELEQTIFYETGNMNNNYKGFMYAFSNIKNPVKIIINPSLFINKNNTSTTNIQISTPNISYYDTNGNLLSNTAFKW